MKYQRKRRDIAYQDRTVTREKLPYPIVLYPGHYGTFFGFRLEEHSPIYLCSCAERAIENYLRFRLIERIPTNSNPTRSFILDSMHFPHSLVEFLMGCYPESGRDVIKHLSFRCNLCHECIGNLPQYRYCHEMYGGMFAQSYGWYINKQAYECGVQPLSFRIIPEICPQAILGLIELDPVTTVERCQELMPHDVAAATDLNKTLQKQNRRVWNLIENRVREKFGHKIIGEAWTNETILFHLVQKIFDNMTIFRHYRPDFLQGMELDIFIKELALGIEYQGIQHFKPVSHWGGKIALKQLQRRDRKKKEICDGIGVDLIYFRYDEDLSNALVRRRLREYID